MKLNKILNNISYDNVANSDLSSIEINNIAIDSRKVNEYSVFVCLKGITNDSHCFIDKVINNNCKVIIIDKEVEYKDGITYIKVNNARDVIGICASNLYNNPSKGLKLLGITGTNGKTSVSYFIEQILKEHNNKTGIIGTLGIKIDEKDIDFSFATSTTPDAPELQNILSIMKDDNVDYVVMEVTSQGLHQKRVIGCDFEVGLLTNITQDHLDYHTTMRNYVDSKLMLFDNCKNTVVNLDSDYASDFINKSSGNILTYSIDSDSDLKAYNIVYTQKSVTFDLDYENNTHNITVNIPGKFTVYNILGTIGVLLFNNFTMSEIISGIKNIKNIPGRIQSVDNNLGISILVDYAHAPDGILNITNSVREFTKNKVITVFGCGGERDTSKRPIMGEIAGLNSDYCIITSDNPRGEDPFLITKDIEVGIKKTNCEYQIIVDRKEAIYKAINLANEGDSIIIAGKGHETYQIFKDKTIDFDDAQIAKEALK